MGTTNTILEKQLDKMGSEKERFIGFKNVNFQSYKAKKCVLCQFSNAEFILL